MVGCIPRQQRFTKPYTVIVQEGDTAKSITESFGVCPCRASELVGANLEQALADVPEGSGQVYKTFAGLLAGSKLRVPASWSDPAAYTVDGRVGASLADAAKSISQSSSISQSGAVDGFQQFLAQVAQVTQGINVPLVPNMPSGSSLNDLYAVVYSWLPYLGNTLGQPGGIDSPPIIPPNQPSPPAVTQASALTSLLALLKSAAEFLKALGINMGLDPRVQRIPWDRYTWTAPIWEQLGKAANAAGISRTQLWIQLDSLAQSLMGPLMTTPPQQSGSWHPLGTTGGHAPNFTATDWTALVQNTPIGDTDWNDNIADFLGDDGVMACVAKNPDRLVAMSKCTTKYELGGLEHFREVLCATEPADPCSVEVQVPPTPIPPLPTTPPVLPTPPGPGGGGADNVNDTDKQQSSNTALYVGAAVAGLLVGGLALWAAGGKD